jgi:hypothetical protein
MLSIIPGISLSQNSHAFIQVIHGPSGKTAYVTYPVSLFSPGIMGWYAYVPGMECYHGAVSLDHMLKGELEYNGSFLDFTGGKVISRKTGADLSLNAGYGCSAIALERKESL